MMDRNKFHNEVQYHNRIHIGQITGVREDDGIIYVTLVSGAKHKMPIPVFGFSMPLISADEQTTLREGARASWMRYMPQVGDFVKVGYGLDNRPEVIGSATWGDLPDERAPQGQLGGYALISRARDRGDAGLNTFFKLRQGEWDMRSTGNAYIRGGRFGTLTLAGGGVVLLMKKEQEELMSRAGLYSFDSTGAKFVLGDVKRQLPTDFQPTQVMGSGKELDLDVSHQAAPSPAPPNAYYRQRAGDLRDASGITEVSSASQPLRYQEQVFDGLPQVAQPVSYLREVDAQGNIAETQGSLATQHTVTGSPLAEFSRTGYLTMNYNAATSITIDSTRINLGATSASEPMLRGNAFNTYLTTTLSVQTAMGPSGPAIVGLVAGELSTKVFTD